MKNLEELEELKQKQKIENEVLMNLVSGLVNVTGDKNFKILQETMIIRRKLSKLSDPTNLIKKDSENDEDKYKTINFLKQINKLMDDFLKEMNIDE